MCERNLLKCGRSLSPRSEETPESLETEIWSRTRTQLEKSIRRSSEVVPRWIQSQVSEEWWKMGVRGEVDPLVQGQWVRSSDPQFEVEDGRK